MAYAVADINQDGILELLLGTTEGLENAEPNSLFTLKEGKPILLESFWSRSSGVISADGKIYCEGSDGAAYTILSSFVLDKNADSLRELTYMSSDYSKAEEKPYFVQMIDGKKHYIAKDEFWDFVEAFQNPPKKMKLKVFSIEG